MGGTYSSGQEESTRLTTADIPVQMNDDRKLNSKDYLW